MLQCGYQCRELTLQGFDATPPVEGQIFVAALSTSVEAKLGKKAARIGIDQWKSVCSPEANIHAVIL
jgi:hypothetical protein